MAEESNLQTKILRDLDSRGKHCVAFKIEKSSVNGTFDVFFTTKKTGPILLETKARKGRVSALQNEMHKNLSECGCKSFFCYTWPQWVSLKNMLGI